MAEQNLVLKKILRGRPEGNTDTEYYNRTLEKLEGKNLEKSPVKKYDRIHTR